MGAKGLIEWNNRVERARAMLRRARADLPDKLEYEIGREIAKKLPQLSDYDTQEIVNKIADALDSSLSVGENVKIALEILNLYAPEYYADGDYLEWLERAQAAPEPEPLEPQPQPQSKRAWQARIDMWLPRRRLPARGPQAEWTEIFAAAAKTPSATMAPRWGK